MAKRTASGAGHLAHVDLETFEKVRAGRIVKVVVPGVRSGEVITVVCPDGECLNVETTATLNTAEGLTADVVISAQSLSQRRKDDARRARVARALRR